MIHSWIEEWFLTEFKYMEFEYCPSITSDYREEAVIGARISIRDQLNEDVNTGIYDNVRGKL